MEKFEPDRDERVTQIIVIELLKKSADYAARLRDNIEQEMAAAGMVRDVDYMLSVGQPDDMLSNPNMTEFMSSKQKGYLTKLIGDLRPLIGRYRAGIDRGEKLDPEVYARAEIVMTIVFDELDSHIRNQGAGGNGTISPRRGSELIDATKQVIEDLQGDLNGV